MTVTRQTSFMIVTDLHITLSRIYIHSFMYLQQLFYRGQGNSESGLHPWNIGHKAGAPVHLGNLGLPINLLHCCWKVGKLRIELQTLEQYNVVSLPSFWCTSALMEPQSSLCLQFLWNSMCSVYGKPRGLKYKDKRQHKPRALCDHNVAHNVDLKRTISEVSGFIWSVHVCKKKAD